jgi:hypothetical protein
MSTNAPSGTSIRHVNPRAPRDPIYRVYVSLASSRFAT